MHCAYAIAVEEIDDIERVAIQDDVHWLARLATNKARIQGQRRKVINSENIKGWENSEDPGGHSQNELPVPIRSGWCCCCSCLLLWLLLLLLCC